MLNFWTLSAIAAFCLGEVLSINFGGSLNGQLGGGPSWGGSGGLNVPTMPNHGDGLTTPSNPDIPMPQIQVGDDKIRIYSVDNCIRVNNLPLCPGEDRIVPKREIIVEMGYPRNSKSVQFWKPKWRDSWHIPEGLNTNNKGAHVFVGSDYCLYNGNMLTQYKVFKIVCAQQCYDGPGNENPWSSLGFGRDSPDYSDPISGLENRNRGTKQACATGPAPTPGPGKKTSFNHEEEVDIVSSAAFPAADAADEYHVESGLDENTPLAWTGLSDEVFNGFNIGDSAAIADTGNFNQVFDKRMKRTVQRKQRQQARRILG